jgi:uncharacterized protein (DUF4213/DUF364 family)
MAASLLQDVVSRLERELGASLSALRLEDLVVGLFFTGVKITGGFSGMARTPIEELRHAVCCPASSAKMPSAGRLRTERIGDLVRWALDRNPLRAAVGVAVVNALSACLWSRQPPACEVVGGRDAFDFLDLARAERAAMVGAFAPYIRALKRRGVPFMVLEKDPEALGTAAAREHFRPAEDAPRVLRESQLVILTGSTIVNHTIDDLLAAVRDGSQVAVVGPTASMLPEPFFARGVSVVGGLKITEPAEMLRTLAEGGSSRHILGKCAEKVVFLASI